jgi:hypothetical protein
LFVVCGFNFFLSSHLHMYVHILYTGNINMHKPQNITMGPYWVW